MIFAMFQSPHQGNILAKWWFGNFIGFEETKTKKKQQQKKNKKTKKKKKQLNSDRTDALYARTAVNRNEIRQGVLKTAKRTFQMYSVIIWKSKSCMHFSTL